VPDEYSVERCGFCRGKDLEEGHCPVCFGWGHLEVLVPERV